MKVIQGRQIDVAGGLLLAIETSFCSSHASVFIAVYQNQSLRLNLFKMSYLSTLLSYIWNRSTRGMYDQGFQLSILNQSRPLMWFSIVYCDGLHIIS